MPQGVRWARMAGVATGVFLLGRGLWLATGQGGVAGAEASPGWMLYGAGVAGYGVVLALPWRRLTAAVFRWAFAVLVVGTLAFAFGQIAEAMFGIHALAAVGRKPGLPAFQGTLVFLALMQVPAVLFARHPELLR